MNNDNLTPRTPEKRPLLWSDTILDLQDELLNLELPPLYIVGGAVRDAYLHRPVKDLDIATEHDAIGIARKIANHFRGDIYVLDAERDVGRAMITINDEPLVIDVSRFRTDEGLSGDLRARDFTVNAVAVELTGDLSQIIDPLDGESDLEKKRIRRCAADSLRTDPIRTLRAVRQSVQLGFQIERDTLADIRACAASINDTSPERIRDEFFNMLKLSRASVALRIASQVGLLEQIIPATQSLVNVEQPEGFHLDLFEHTITAVEKMVHIIASISYDRTDETAAAFDMGMMVIQFDRYREQLNDWIFKQHVPDRDHRQLLVLGALLAGIGKPVRDEAFEAYPVRSAEITRVTANRLRLSNAETKFLMRMVRYHRLAQDQAEWTRLALHRYWRDLRQSGIDVVLLALADYRAAMGNHLKQNDWLALIERGRILLSAYFDQYDELVEPAPLLDGNDLLTSLDIKAGPVVGELLTRIKEEQVIGTITTRDEALAYARAYLEENQT